MTATNLSRVGMLGLGSMGGPIAANIARRGFEVHGFDPRREALEAAAEDGVRPWASAAEVARQARVALAIPYDYAQVERAVFGQDGLVEGWSEPGVFVLMSTVGPENARALDRALRDRGHRLVDCPVSGGRRGSVAGTLTLMVGAAPEDLALCRPVLESFSRNIFHIGEEPGTGQAAKLVNQLLVLVHHAATTEALALAARTGCDLQQIYDMIVTCAGNSVIFEDRGRAIIDQSFKTGGSLNILVKDARLVADSARASGTPLFLASAAAQLFEAAKAMGYGDQDDATVAKLYEQILGQKLGA